MVRAHPNVEYIGEVTEHEKAQFLGDALGVLFPIHWREPFGLVMIEAMACGTPVVAWRHGAVPEVIEEGITGHVVDNIDDAIVAVGELRRFDRTAVRKAFERRFTAEHMAEGYIEVYRRLLNGIEQQSPKPSAAGEIRVVA
jgi:glycosyltransferase involved in cell wall biosynthesis